VENTKRIYFIDRHVQAWKGQEGNIKQTWIVSLGDLKI
jgi:hypothetical protein